MSVFSRVALFATFSLATAALAGGTGAAAAFAAAIAPDSGSSELLPQSVISEAQEEAGRTIDDYTIVPEPTDEEVADAPARAGSLAVLVADRLDSATADREEECLAAAVYFESRSESLEGQLAVARVVLNRAASGRFPASVCGVVMQRGQFSFVRGGGFPPIARSSRDWREAVAIARIASDGQWESGAERALYFHAARVSPGWRMTRVAAIGNHIFYR